MHNYTEFGKNKCNEHTRIGCSVAKMLRKIQQLKRIRHSHSQKNCLGPNELIIPFFATSNRKKIAEHISNI